jgi:hypothetical protein
VIVLPATYEPIATATATGSNATITFSSIAATFTDLVIVIEGTNTGSCIKRLQFNGDTGANYSSTFLYGTGAAAASARYSVAYLDVVNASTNRYTTLVQIMNYSNTTTNKTYLSRHGAAAVSTEAAVGLWRSTAAINSVSIIGSANEFSSGSTFTLYGIRAA